MVDVAAGFSLNNFYRCYNSAHITAVSINTVYAAGIIALVTHGFKISDCGNTGNISATTKNVGAERAYVSGIVAVGEVYNNYQINE